MIIIYIDIILLVILVCLTVFACGYCFYRVHRLQRDGQVEILLRPTKVLFSHKSEGDSCEQLRTVVAYQNPFTGDYCIHKSRLGTGYVNAMQTPDSPDSGVSDEYEPLNLDPVPEKLPEGTKLSNAVNIPQSQLAGSSSEGLNASKEKLNGTHEEAIILFSEQPSTPTKDKISPKPDDYSLNKTWNWKYTEYQI
ncbi:uncharacterized protein LOC114240410 [Bombyx mandarina]|uniref:Uncharacterized protein LOC114240410 n=1 Tax=Bombyx mandarina TaxID=7092 RepID=A0A6J2JB50_BOMMA|nr:uncharacterized protein LOC114240410 [Bombyx mandarina]